MSHNEIRDHDCLNTETHYSKLEGPGVKEVYILLLQSDLLVTQQ